MVCGLYKLRHFVVSILHVVICTFKIISKVLNTHILRSNLRAEILSFVLCRLDYTNNLIKLLVLAFTHILL